MELPHVLELLRGAEQDIRALGVEHLFVFGSTVRGEARADSDVDMFVDRDGSSRFGFMELTNLQFMLEELLGAEVDIGTRAGLHPVLREQIEREAVRVF